jgi:hypothetical protein
MNLSKIEHKMTMDFVLPQITVRGNCKQLKTNRPKDGIAAYVWRMVRFHGGIDVCLPMTIHFHLANQVENDIPGIKFKCGIFGAFEKDVLDRLDKLADDCCRKLGLSMFGAARAWQKLI